MKSLESRECLQRSLDLGAVIGEAEPLVVETRGVTALWLIIVVVTTGCLCFGQEVGWIGTALAMVISALSVMIVCRPSGSEDHRLRVHENGICLDEANVSTEIHYDELHEYCCEKTRVIGHGHTRYETFEFEMKSCNSPLRTIKWENRTFCDKRFADKLNQETSIDFDKLNIQISKKAAGNMAAMLKVDRKIPWGNSNFIHDNGVEVRVKTRIVLSEMRFIPWPEIRMIKFQDGKLLLSSESFSGSVKISCSEPNLLPGFFLIDEQMKTQFGNRTVCSQTEAEIKVAFAKELVIQESPG